MAKIDISKGFTKPDASRKKVAANATNYMTGGFNLSDLTAEQAKLMVKAIPISKIREREVNEFTDIDITSLCESIRRYGLINPLSVVHRDAEDVYIISSGHRRFKALSILHEENPDSEDYELIDCAVYEITTDPFKLSQGLPYITEEQENGIYRDSNLESRQLSYTDVAHQIRYIVARLEEPEFQKKLVEKAKAKDSKGVYERPDRVRLIVEALAQQNYSGWARETIRRYLKVKDEGREDLLDQIESGEITVLNAYNKVISETNKKRERKTNKMPAVRKAVKNLSEEAKDRKYNNKEITELKEIIANLQTIIDNNSTK